MLAPRGAQEPQNVRKPHSRSPLGPPLRETIFGTFSDFSMFFCMFFWRAVLKGFRERFSGDFRSIFEGFFEDFSHNFRRTLHIAKPHLDMLFVMFEAHCRFQKSMKKVTKSANSEVCFSEVRSERILEPSWDDFGNISGGFGAQNA